MGVCNQVQILQEIRTIGEEAKRSYQLLNHRTPSLDYFSVSEEETHKLNQTEVLPTFINQKILLHYQNGTFIFYEIIFLFRFKKLSVVERINALSTIYPRLTDTFINMHQRIDQNGQSSFAWQEPSYNTQTTSYLLQYVHIEIIK
jgi:hypothetical protein